MANRAISGCLSYSSIPLLLSETSLSFSRVTLTYFILSSYERALSISGLARLEVKQRLFRSSWRAFASTHALVLSSISPREALLACVPSSPWNLTFFNLGAPFPLDAPALILPFLAKVRLSLTLTFSLLDLMVWTDGFVPFLFGKGFGVLANCSLCGTEATLSFSAGPEYFSSFAEACAILQAYCWSTTFGLGPGELSGFWGSMVFRDAPIFCKGSGNNNNIL